MNNDLQIYFAGSIRGGRNQAQKYEAIIAHLKRFGTVFTEHVGSNELLFQEKNMSDKEIHDRDMEWLEKADVVCAEVTQPSLGVGYELAMASVLKKKGICLFDITSDSRLSAMINGQSSFSVAHYSTIGEAFQIIHNYFSV